MITLNPHITPYKRSEAFLICKDLLANGSIDKACAEALYKFFMPKSPAKPKTDWQWVAKAVAKPKEVRGYLHYLWSDGNKLFGCDGHRMHFCSTNLPEGFYCPKTLNPVDNESNQIGKYPNVYRVIPNCSERGYEDFQHNMESYRHIVKEQTPDMPIVEIKDKVQVNKQYLEQGVNGFDAQLWIGPNPTDNLYGEHEYGNFVICPIRPDKKP